MDLEASGSCGRAELIVMRREHKSLNDVSSQQRARQVDRVQAAQGRRKGSEARSSTTESSITRLKAWIVNALERGQNAGHVVADLARV